MPVAVFLRAHSKMKMYSYLLERIASDEWRWTVFDNDEKAVNTGAAKSEETARALARAAIHELKKNDAEE